MQTTHYALKTSEKEKLSYFKNIIEKTALGESPEKTISQVYLNLIDRYTVWHIRMLSLFDDPETWFANHCLDKPNIRMAGLNHVLHLAFPELNGQKEFYSLLWAELGRDGMHDSGSLQTTTSNSAMFVRRTTDLGRNFLRFIGTQG